MLVIHRPVAIDDGRRERAARVAAEQAEPALVGARGREVEAFVTREAERAAGCEQQREVSAEQRDRDQRVGAELHRASNAKQKSALGRVSRSSRTSIAALSGGRGASKRAQPWAATAS